MSETSLSEQDRSLEFLKANSRGIRLMIIELERYNEIRELLIAHSLRDTYAIGTEAGGYL